MIKKIVVRYNSLSVQVKASFWFLICSFLQKGISVITTPIFTRLLSTAEYGQYSVFNSWLTIITVFVSLNLYSGVYTQGLVKFEKKSKEFSSSMQGLCFTLTIFWTIVYLLFKDFWNGIFGLTTVQMLAMIIMIWSTSVFSFWSVEQRVDFKYRKLVIITLIVSVAKPLVGIIFVMKAEDKVTARILGLLLVELAAYTWFFFAQMKKGKRFCSKELWKYALIFNIPLVPHYLSQVVLSGVDRIMISKMVSTSTAGIYNLAYQISLIMTMLNTSLMKTIEPWLYKKIKANEIDEISNVAYPAFAIIAFANLVLIAFAPEMVRIFATKDYIEAIWVVPPVAMSVYFMFAYTFFAVFEFYYEKTKYITLATVIGAILNIVLNYIFIPIYGYIAAGYITLICYIIYAIFHYCFMQKLCRDNIDGKTVYNTKLLILMSVIFIATGFMFLFTYTITWLRYAIIALMFIVAVIKRKEISKIIKKLFGLKRNKQE